MKVVSPGHHPAADKFWKEELNCKLNGARTLGSAMAKYFPPLLEPYFDLMVCYSASFPFEIPAGARRVAVFCHQNYPYPESFNLWQKIHLKLRDYETIYFYNDPTMVKLVGDFAPCYYLPRFIDTTAYPKLHCNKVIDTLWLGNAWASVSGAFETYKKENTKPYWISKGTFGCGDKKIRELTRLETLQKLCSAKRVWAIGISQLEAQYYGCEVVPYKDGVLPFYDQNSIRGCLKDLLEKARAERFPGLGE